MKANEYLQRIAEAIESLTTEIKESNKILRMASEGIREIRQELKDPNRPKAPVLLSGVRIKELEFTPSSPRDTFTDFIRAKGVSLQQGAAVTRALLLFIEETFENVSDEAGARQILEKYRTSKDGEPESYAFLKDFAREFVAWRKKDEKRKAKEQDNKYRASKKKNKRK